MQPSTHTGVVKTTKSQQTKQNKKKSEELKRSECERRSGGELELDSAWERGDHGWLRLAMAMACLQWWTVDSNHRALEQQA
jgi:hypothetical protein